MEEAKTIPLITEIQRFSLQDGPGIRTTIFMKGCALKCPWCHNPETQSLKQEFYYYEDRCTGCGRCVEVCPSGATSLKTDRRGEPSVVLDRSACISCFKCVEACLSDARSLVAQDLSMEEILREAESDRPFFQNSGGGVTLSGGDPLVFPEFTASLAQRLKAHRIHVGLETSCFAKWENIEPLLESVDLFLVDIKTMNPNKHLELLGWPLDPILDNIERLVKARANVRVHLPIVPGVNDTDEDYRAYIGYLSELAHILVGVDVLGYHCYGESKYTFLGRSYSFKDVADVKGKEVLPLAKGLRKVGVASVTVGGLVGMGSDKGLKPAANG